MSDEFELASAFDALGQFEISGSLTKLERLVRGHTNQSFVACFGEGAEQKRFVLQRISDQAFGDIPGLMGNVEIVVQKLKQAVAGSNYSALELVSTRGGEKWLNTESGAWRCMVFMENTECFERCTSTEQAFEVAKLVGWFQGALADLEASSLVDVVPDFFNPVARLDQFERALATMVAGSCGTGLQDEVLMATIREALSLSGLAERFGLHLQRGDFPARVIHGDTKLNNVLFDSTTGKPRALVDLDTTMPGFLLYDFGDLVRTAAATSAEDEPDTSLAGIDRELFAALKAGYLESAGHMLTEKERQVLPFAAPVVSYMIGLRFLTDHLSGDAYFGASRPGQNLDRARVQFAQTQSFFTKSE